MRSNCTPMVAHNICLTQAYRASAVASTQRSRMVWSCAHGTLRFRFGSVARKHCECQSNVVTFFPRAALCERERARSVRIDTVLVSYYLCCVVMSSCNDGPCNDLLRGCTHQPMGLNGFESVGSRIVQLHGHARPHRCSTILAVYDDSLWPFVSTDRP